MPGYARLVLARLVDVVHERLGDLEDVDGQVSQVAQLGLALPKFVEGQAYASCTSSVEECLTFPYLGDDVLCDLQQQRTVPKPPFLG